MLVEFRVKNFYSIRDEMTLSMVANRSKDLRDTNVVEPSATGVPPLVRSAAIFGPNGAGKTSIIRAIQLMEHFVTSSASGFKPGDKIPVTPFLLSTETREEPSEFEVILVASGVRYQYGFAVNQTRVIEEWLYAAPDGRNQTWLERSFDENTDTYDWKMGSYLKGQKQSIRDSTRENALFLSTGAQLNNPQLQLVWEWFQSTLQAFAGRAPISEGFTNKICAEDEINRDTVVEFLRNAAISVQDIRIKTKQGDEDRSSHSEHSESPELPIDESNEPSFEPYFRHDVHGDSEGIEFPLMMESAGTRYVYAWAGPWIDVLERGLVLALDELDSSLHTHLAQHLIRLFNNPTTNPNGAQLIFTTHSTPIMGNRSLLRRDQVWFVHKDKYDGTCLTAFIDFQPRKGEDREKNYLGGRYGAIPELPILGRL